MTPGALTASSGSISMTPGAMGVYWPALRDHPPPVPPQLLKKLACKETSSIGKVKVLLRVAPSLEVSQSCKVLSVDPRKKTVTLFDPGSAVHPSSAHTEESRVGIAAPKMFAFDGIYTHEDSQTEICSAALTDVIVAVLRGADGAVFSFGQSNLGQGYTMVGGGESCHTLGVMPSAVWWLYKALQDHRANTGARFSVRISALQIAPGDVVTDLLAQYAQGEQSPGVFLMEDSGSSLLLAHAAEVRAPTVERAAQLLDAALAHRLVDDQGRHAHLVFTLNIYQYSVDTSAKGGVAGGRSRLHLMDFGALERGKGPSRLTLSSLGNVILAIFNGQKHLPYKDGKLPRLLRECVGSVRCVAAMLVHVSPTSGHYQETLATIQLASRVHRLRRRRIKPHMGGSGSGGSSEESRSGRSSRGTITDTGGSSSVDPSSSEQSCDTVIYVGPAGDDATDGEHPPVYLPSINSGDNRCSMNKALRGSVVDGASKMDSQRTPKKSSKVSGSGKSPSKPSKHSVTSKDGSHSSPHRTKDSHKSRDGVSGSGAVGSGGSLPRTPTKYSSSSGAKLSSGATPKSPKSPHVSRHSRHKVAAGMTPHADASGAQSQHGGSEEQWIDGPRFHRAKVYDGHKMKSYELETWIDGPEATYGYMDDHKKSMIQKWVETQNAQVQPKSSEHSQKSPKHKQYKELTQFKTVEDEESSPRHKEKHREKRKSSECKELRKDGQHTTTREKDVTPRKRRSYGDKPHAASQPVVEPEETNKPKVHSYVSEPLKTEPPKAQEPESASPVNKVEPHAVSHVDKVPESGVRSEVKRQSSVSEVSLSSTAFPDANANLPPATVAAAIGQRSGGHQGVCDVRMTLTNQTAPATSAIRGHEVEEEEEEEVLQVTYVENETPRVDMRTLAPDVEEDRATEVRSSSDETTTAEGDPMEEDQSQVSSEDAATESLTEEEVVYPRPAKFILHEVRDLDEGEEELEAALDRWLAEEDREYIEVEEPEEPVEMVDSWCQVTEEDIERTLAEAGVHFIPFLQHRHLLPTLQEEPGESAEPLDHHMDHLHQLEALNNQVTSKIGSGVLEEPLQPLKVPEQMVGDAAFLHPAGGDHPGGEFKSSPRYEQMIKDPNFTAKTHYFAKRLEELQQLHEFYRNLAKQAPRGRNSVNSPSAKELTEVSEDESSVSEGGEEPEPKILPQPFFSQEGTLTSMKMSGRDYEFSWKSLLPEEIDVQSETHEEKTEGEDTSSEVSKDVNDPLYDIQSDIMPYLPSNYVSLTTLSALRQPDGASNPNLNGEFAHTEPQADAAPPDNAVPLTTTLQERLPGNGASLSDDESNVKQVKVKKEKRKKKLGLLSKSSKSCVYKEEADCEEGSTHSKLSWSRFFGSPKHKGSPKDTSKKSSKSNSKSSNKSPTSSGKSSEKSDKKSQRERERSKDFKTCASKDNKSNKEGKVSHSQENHYGPDTTKQPDNKNTKALQKLDSDRSNGSLKSKSPARKSSENRSGRSGRRESREQPQQQCQQPLQQQQQCQQPPQQQQQQQQSQRYQGFHWDSPLPPFLPVTTAAIHPGYDSGADSGVGLKVIPRARRSRGESRHGESSGYESVIRDSECSSFGSSQDSGLDDDGLKGKAEGRGSENIAAGTTKARHPPQTRSKISETHPPKHVQKTTCPSITSHSHSHSHSKYLPSRMPSGSPLRTQKTTTTATSALEVKASGGGGSGGGVGGSPSMRVPVEEFDEEDVARYESHKTEEDIAKCRRTQEKIRALREKQDQLKQELEAAKSRLMIDKSRWSFELHVEECMTWRDDGYVEALQQETIILAKRVMAARSRLLLSTCFDASANVQDKDICEGEAFDVSPSLQDKDLCFEEGFLDDFLFLPDRDVRQGASALDCDLSVISEEEMVEDEEAEDKVHVLRRGTSNWSERDNEEDDDEEDRGRILGMTQREHEDDCVTRGKGDAVRHKTQEEPKGSCDKPNTDVVMRRFGTPPGSRIGSGVSIGEGFNVEDWRRLKESFIL
ncbi:kinesin-like protein KIF26B isoform X2 [Homarus americanus]|uniref:kinesin-like protein KIF26B isoform X2 n=1 Tax=Homarus americanus TaxID=6706 RepID=UPI001C444226|nr:kinesin-like protein KIF26B isoform X2 [Homarus americanus]